MSLSWMASRRAFSAGVRGGRFWRSTVFLVVVIVLLLAFVGLACRDDAGGGFRSFYVHDDA